MANALTIAAVPKTSTDGVDVPSTEVKVTVESHGERDLSAHIDGMDLIQQIASALRLAISVRDESGDVDPGASSEGENSGN